MLRDIQADPTRPLKLGSHAGEDFIDLLIRLVPEARGPVRQMMILCLMSYQDPRTAAFMVEAFRKSRDAAIVLRLGQRLLLERGIDFFRPFLWEKGTAQAMAAAAICQPESNLTPQERLRIALLLPGNPPIPPIDAEHLAAWLEELSGPLRANARRRAEEQPDQLMHLWPSWQRLHPTEQIWLLDLTARVDPEHARQQVQRLLEAARPPAAVVELALKLGLPLPAVLLHHEDSAVRAAAVSQGLADAELTPYLKASVSEALAATARCAPEKLLDLLSDERWQVRAQAVRLLAASNHRDIERVKTLVSSPAKGEQVAAVELLRCWGEQAWLEEQLLETQSSLVERK